MCHRCWNGALTTVLTVEQAELLAGRIRMDCMATWPGQVFVGIDPRAQPMRTPVVLIDHRLGVHHVQTWDDWLAAKQELLEAMPRVARLLRSCH